MSASGDPPSLVSQLIMIYKEVVLSLLISSFKFENTEKKIMWKMPGIAAPVAEGDEFSHSTMPLKVTLVDENSVLT
jgi:hypothetical protein